MNPFLKHVGIVLFLFLMVLLTCERVNAPYQACNLQFGIEDVSTTEVWIKLSTNTNVPEIEIRRDQLVVFHEQNFKGDTIITDSGLEPGMTFQYQLYLKRKNRNWNKCQMVQATTPDTTSHNFQWTIYEFPSPYGSPTLYDVEIIDENDIWVVGEIKSDSIRPWEPYNAVHWDGNKWELKKIPFVDKTGYIWYTPISSIFAFSPNEIWFEAGIHYNGQEFISKPINIDFPSNVKRMWGPSSQDVFIVGYFGLIAHYNGRKWKKIPTETTLPIEDIWGGWNPKTGKQEVICVTTGGTNPRSWTIIDVQQDNAIPLSRDGLSPFLDGIWFVPGKGYYVVGDGIFFKNDIYSDSPWKMIKVNSYFSHGIRGNNLCDIVIAGAYGEILHYNGYSWENYTDVLGKRIGYEEIDIKGDIVVAVGDFLGNAVITMGKRY